MQSTTVQIREKGLDVLIGPSAKASKTKLIPGARALFLEALPTPTGTSLDAASGLGRNQVGGFPCWTSGGSPLPHCPLCKQRMRVLANIDSGLTPFGRMKFSSMLHCLWCDGCSVSSTYNPLG